MKTEFFLSATGDFSSTASFAFPTGVDSPVSTASSVFSSTTSVSLPSAGIRSPSSRIVMSPGTTSLAGIIFSFLSRSTRALGAVSFFIASSAFSERYSWMKPTTELRATMTAMVAASTVSPIRKAIAVATRSMTTNMSLNWLRNIWRRVTFSRSTSSLYPNSWSRR